MWFLLIACCVALIVAVLQQCGIISPLYAVTWISIRRGQAKVARGRLNTGAKAYVEDILREANVTRGFVAITSDNRVRFSRTIPSSIQQQLRNVLLNQWS